MKQSRRSISFTHLAFLCLLAVLDAAQAGPPDAEQAFTTAARLFQGGWYDRAETEFARFLAMHPQSTNRPEALLLQAESRYQLKDYDGAVRLLEGQGPTAGAWADRYLYWLAETQLQRNRFDLAAQAYAGLLKEFPSSPLRLEASYGEAFARFRSGETARTIELLRQPSSPFPRASQGSTNNAVIVRGNLLLAEALFAHNDLRGAEQVLTELKQRGLNPEAEWQRQYFLARVELADQRRPEALARVTNLVSTATMASNTVLLARSLTLQAEILEGKDPDRAVQAYELVTKLPDIGPDQSRQALLKMVELAVAQKKLTNAAVRLEAYLKEHPRDAESDLIRLTLGEVYLKQFYAAGAERGGTNATLLVTNLLRSAHGQFDFIISQMTNSAYLGKAWFDRGCCAWEEAQALKEPARFADAQAAFRAASDRLPKSLEQATALFKLGDCAYQLRDYTNALNTFSNLVSGYAEFTPVQTSLLDRALHQLVSLHLELKDTAGARAALDKLLQQFPQSADSAHALFLFGQAIVQAGDTLGGRAVFADFEKRFPNSPLLADVRLASAKACAIQTDWSEAIQQYDRWVNLYTNHLARAQAEFDRAWCYDQLGTETNALRLFTNFVAQFPQSTYAPLAQLWVADYYLNQRNYRDAEIHYQLLYRSTNAAAAPLAVQAQLMAAKAAFFRTDFPWARYYLTNLVNSPNSCPEAWFMLGDVELEDSSSTNRLVKFETAINFFQRMINNYPSSRLVPLAMGKIAHCHFQLGSQDSARYERATNQYLQVIAHPLSDDSTRSQAEVALGIVLERMAGTNRTDLLNEALAHYLNVVHGIRKSEEPDPLWLSIAARNAGTLAVERLQRFDEAERLYTEMLLVLPSLRPTWEKRLDALRQQRAQAAKP